MSADAVNGNVFLQSTKTAGVTLQGNNHAGGTFDFLANGPATIANISTDAGSIKITSTAGLLQTAPGSNITAREDDVTIWNQSLLKTDRLFVGGGTTIQALASVAGLGNVSLIKGALVLNTGKPPKSNVTYSTSGGGSLDNYGFEIDAMLISDIDPKPIACNATNAADFTQLESGNLSLDKGSVLVAPAKDLVIEHNRAKLNTAANAIVLVMASSNGLHVYNLHDERKHSVVVNAGSHRLVLAPGHHITLTDGRVRSFEDVNPAEAIGYRSIVSQELAHGDRAFVSEFSGASAIDVVKPLRALMIADNPEARRIRNRLLKTSAIILHLTSGKPPYQQYLKPHLTALR
ncbi:MAG TPA: hypothetical protein V6D17_23355 [Candidatus Obscuribacterales bacterium]